MIASPLTDQEIIELLSSTLHGPLPSATMNRVFATLAMVPKLRAIARILHDPTPIDDALAALAQVKDGLINRQELGAVGEGFDAVYNALESIVFELRLKGALSGDV